MSERALEKEIKNSSKCAPQSAKEEQVCRRPTVGQVLNV